MRLAPETGIPGLGPADPSDAPDLAIGAGEPGTDRSTEAAATLAPSARTHPSPSATSAMGGLGTTPTAGSILVPTATATATAGASETRSPAPGATGDAPPPQAPPAAQEPSRPAPTTPQHPPAPGRPTPSPTPTPAPQPSEPDDRGVCVPVIGLCIDLFGSSGGR
ncbi:hypothetical protein [Streptomyces sp. NPDC057412]|uniref:hypothetical protein n=1 Tax=Streptomyces sp. NPDC057412 TaxID=3346123 RepID=UPI00369CCFD1